MTPLSPLQILVLADLYGKSTPVSRYEVMANLNEIASLMAHPYSPGAVYHCIKGLASEKVIKFNQKMVEIDVTGRESLVQHLTQAAPPSSILNNLVELIALQGIDDPKVRHLGRQRLRLNMIKNNHIDKNPLRSGQREGYPRGALKYCHQEMYKALERICLEIGD